MAGGVLARSQMRVRAFRAEEGDAGGVLADGVELVLQQRLLGQNGVFNDQLEQAGDVEAVQVVRFGGGDQRV